MRACLATLILSASLAVLAAPAAAERSDALPEVMDFAADYDPAKGLTISIPTLFVLPEESFSNTMWIHMTINQATGQIETRTELGRD